MSGFFSALTGATTGATASSTATNDKKKIVEEEKKEENNDDVDETNKNTTTATTAGTTTSSLFNSYFNKISKTISNAFLTQDILVRPLGNVLYFVPPYSSTKEEMKTTFETTYNFLKTL